MNILSLFDGISCGRVALERAGAKVDKYFASEIDKYAIHIAKKNYPDTIHLGSITGVGMSVCGLRERNGTGFLYANGFGFPKQTIDMIIGGSPCQDLSIAKKDGKGLQGEKSGLFFEYVRLLKEVKPKYFLLENVASMKKADKEEITRILTELYPDTQCYLINSALVSAQNRRRLYFTNIQGVKQPTDKGIVLKDILEETVDEKYYVKSNIDGYEENANCFYQKNSVGKLRQGYEVFKDESKTYSLNCSHAGNTMVRIGQFNTGGQDDRIYSPEGKSVSLSANGGGRGAKTGLYEVKEKSNTIRTSGRGSGIDDKHTVYTGSVIRKLTPIECEKLQTLPVNYTEGVSNSQRYKAIGNGWTVDVIAHIFSYIK